MARSSDTEKRSRPATTGRDIVPSDRTRKAITKRLASHTSAMTTATLATMSSRHSWFRRLSAEERSWISIVARSGIDGFVTWFSDDQTKPYRPTNIFGVAPASMTRKISLRQTVDLVRTTIDVVEDQIRITMSRSDRQVLLNAIVHYSREVAFAAAEVYARAAERRGTWDERLESLVIDAVVRSEPDDELISRASTLGWRSGLNLCVVVGRGAGSGVGVRALRRAGEQKGLTILAATQAHRLVAVVAGEQIVDDASAVKVVAALADHFSEGPIVVGPVVDELTNAPTSARAAMAGARVACGWPEGPRVLSSTDLLPERALTGDEQAIAWLVEQIYEPLSRSTGNLMETCVAFLDHGGSVEGTGRALYIHPNTVRYRLKKIQETTGYSPNDPREAYVMRLAITFGRLHTTAQNDQHRPDLPRFPFPALG